MYLAESSLLFLLGENVNNTSIWKRRARRFSSPLFRDWEATGGLELHVRSASQKNGQKPPITTGTMAALRAVSAVTQSQTSNTVDSAYFGS
jgi:hypothetical protein